MALDPPKYAITISPPPSTMSLIYRLDEYKSQIDKVLRRMCKYFILYPEFDKTARLHFHGVCTGMDMIKYYATKYKLDRIGWTFLTPLKTFKDQLQWVCYCQKEFRRTSRVFLEKKYAICPILKVNKRKQEHKFNENKIKTLLDYFNYEPTFHNY